MEVKFSEEARRAIECAHDEAYRLKQDYIGTEHLLLGLIKREEEQATKILTKLGINLYNLRDDVEEAACPSNFKRMKIEYGPTMVSWPARWFSSIAGVIPRRPKLPITARAKRVFELSGIEARALCSKEIGPDHILLGLLKEEEGIAATVLEKHQVNYRGVYNKLKLM